MTQRTIRVDRKLFDFRDFVEWLRTSDSRYRECGYDRDRTICVDATGIVVAGLKDFQNAFMRRAFPVSVYLLAGSRKYSEGHYEGTWRAAHAGVRTDWRFIGEEAREAWRNEIDGIKEVGNG